MTIADEVRRFWDDDSAIYDNVPNHHPTAPAERAAWAAALTEMLPPAPARVLDCGAGTGFLSLLAARLGHQVTALDLSPGMLARLESKAAGEGLEVEVVEGSAERPPPGPFDAVIERHLLWTLPDPLEALRAWHRSSGGGRLVLFEGMWGGHDSLERLRHRTKSTLGRVAAGRAARGAPRGGHHAEYPTSVRAAMPLGGGTSPSAVATLVADAGWSQPRLHRLRDVEWAASLDAPVAERILGSSPRFAVVAGPARPS
ncbi:MAG TPA: class I SAM-dependent methyltransferase [Acidimicrobiales bacterium]|jgi:SAM-dependent methyltransferase|nr:class I SAM-dependent methyltransferase [Acidimicrobiales bacterium]